MSFRSISHFVPVIIGGLLGIACTQKSEPPPPAAPPPKAAEATPKPAVPAGPVEVAAQPGAKTATVASAAPADPTCFAPWSEEGAPKSVLVGGKTYSLKGTHLEEVTTDEDNHVVLGVVADIKEDSTKNMANLDAIVKFFKAEKVEAIVVAGDIGESKEQIAHALSKIAAAGLPVFAIIGNYEGRAAYKAGIDAAAAQHANVFDLNKVRLVRLDDAALVTVPGYHNKTYLHAEDGCLYGPADFAQVKPAILAARGRPVVMVSHGPPKQDGPDALDRTLDQVNVGDPAMAAFLKENGIKFGLFANVREAGGRGTDLSGTSLIGEGKASDELYVSAGAADSGRWNMNDNTESVGMAVVYTVNGTKASFKVLRLGKKNRT